MKSESINSYIKVINNLIIFDFNKHYIFLSQIIKLFINLIYELIDFDFMQKTMFQDRQIHCLKKTFD